MGMRYKMARVLAVLLMPFDKEVSGGHGYKVYESRLPSRIQQILNNVFDWLHREDQAAD